MITEFFLRQQWRDEALLIQQQLQQREMQQRIQSERERLQKQIAQKPFSATYFNVRGSDPELFLKELYVAMTNQEQEVVRGTRLAGDDYRRVVNNTLLQPNIDRFFSFQTQDNTVAYAVRTSILLGFEHGSTMKPEMHNELVRSIVYQGPFSIFYNQFLPPQELLNWTNQLVLQGVSLREQADGINPLEEELAIYITRVNEQLHEEGF